MAIFDKTKDLAQLKRDVAKANKRIRNIEKSYGEDSCILLIFLFTLTSPCLLIPLTN